jgi:hypothetical protein
MPHDMELRWSVGADVVLGTEFSAIAARARGQRVS